MTMAHNIEAASRLLRQADGLLITAGAGMGVDSGLPDFRGDQGFWKAYPPLGRAQIGFAEIANPAAFRENAALAWGFYGHRLQLYRETVAHQGFDILQKLSSNMAQGCFVFTSNVDGQFQKALFDADRVVECHGSIHHLQCIDACTGDGPDAIWSAANVAPVIDASRCEMVSALPHCPHCGALARPNILMFNDSDWVPDRTDLQYDALEAWIGTVQRPVVIELGAGTHIPSVRHAGADTGAPLIRINPRASAVAHATDVALPMRAD
jgi:NAD-dependent SIR2 family protein deacetylase